MFESLTTLAKKLFGDANEREIKKLQPLVDHVNNLEPKYEKYSDEELAGMTATFKQKLENGASLDDIQADAFAVVREVAKRTLGMRHYDCQIIGGAVIHEGKVAEMKTGEGKTLVATMPVFLNALEGKGAHVVTVNDYLADRDADWMAPVYNFLGMSVGKILTTERSTSAKRKAYRADVTYGTNNEFGFDYLRDNMKFSIDEYVQRGHHFAIIDEVDSILIDEARTPLIISGPMNVPVDTYKVIDAVIPMLQEDVHFVIDEKSKSCTLTDEGIGRVEEKLGIDNLYDTQNIEVLHHVSQSLKAHHIFKRDKDYVVRGNDVVIVDEFTGRLMPGRRWSDGLHQAVEAKEKVSIQQESQVYASITFQNLFRMYDKLSGMTGTAETEAAELAAIYDVDTLVIPTNKPIARLDHDDIVYKTQMEKFRAVAEDIRERHAEGQPILVGTTSVEKSEMLARILERFEIDHEVLNAKNHARESDIVANAGRKGAVTISTNMAGRGTDIKLGGNPEVMAADEHDPEEEPEEYKKALAYYQEQCRLEGQEVKDSGGLCIIGTERHESRRVDNQLRGRSGRQGDPGESRFYLSLEDDLLRIFSSDKITVWMERMGLPDDEPIEHRWITRAIENAQKKVEGFHFNSRKNLLEYDDVMNYQRNGVYDLRKRALKGDDIRGMVHEALDNVVDDIMDDYLTEGLHPEHWNVPKMRENMKRVFGLEWDEEDDTIRDFSREEIRERMRDEARQVVEKQAEAAGEEAFDTFARMNILQYTDSLWKDHLLALDRLRQGVGLRGYGQRNPLLEYKREAFQMYLLMSAMRDESVLTQLCSAEPELMQAAAEREGKSTARRLAAGNFKLPGQKQDALAADPNALARLVQSAAKPDAKPKAPAKPKKPSKGVEAKRFGLDNDVRRNAPCPCGSGNKFKKCCLKVPDEAEAASS